MSISNITLPCKMKTMLNQESLLFMTVIAFFTILLITQLVATGCLLTEHKDQNDTKTKINRVLIKNK
jgi:hypothetical protein